MAQSHPFSPNQRLTNDGVRGASGSIFDFDGVGAVCLVGNVVSSSSFIYPWQLFREAEFGSFVDVWGELLLEAVLRLRERRVWVRRIQLILPTKYFHCALPFDGLLG